MEVIKHIVPAERKKIISYGLLGFAIGGFISAILFFAWFYANQSALAAENRKQTNLASAFALSPGHQQRYPVSVKVISNEPMEASVSHDGFNWYTPKNGVMDLGLYEGEYTFEAVCSNRHVYLSKLLNPNERNEIVMDISAAPTAPEIISYEIPYGESALIPLEIENTRKVTLDHSPPNGISIIENNANFWLSIDGEQMNYGFYTFLVNVENESGNAVTVFNLTIPRKTPPIYIHDVEGLNQIRTNLSGNFILSSPLDFSGITDWAPIGTTEFPFVGTFDGDGYEISGFHVEGEIKNASIFGVTKNAILQNIIVREPYINCTYEEDGSGYAAIAQNLDNSLLKNCAVFGGSITVKTSTHTGINAISGSSSGFIYGCYNSCSVTSLNEARKMAGVGGITGSFVGTLMVNCANEGNMKGSHLTGGLCGLQGGHISRSYNTGDIRGLALAGEYRPAAFSQTNNIFATMSYSYFRKGSAPWGTKAYEYATMIDLQPIDAIDFRNPSMLPYLGSFDGDDPEWAYASLDAFGPVPSGIFKGQADAPTLYINGFDIQASLIPGVQYFYALDGNDPYTACKKGVDSVSLTLKNGQTISIFAAKQGARDSEIINYTAGGLLNEQQSR